VLDQREMYLFNDSIVIECDEGYKVQGENEIFCQDNREWSGTMPKCKGKHFFY